MTESRRKFRDIWWLEGKWQFLESSTEHEPGK